ncbi:hypothetical protein L3556_00660 [Candidatus Synechococcus calcipolaris G9]|uniref:Uncharacterized protein n=1 Tax=Candidatus Synechococcus calcipolaris G9 TaxID=1497997 RepID=A0ABT6EWF7_9SYNE|nr:choice-of-anchor Q domain-containing protein [Candidatus Synechococcus calcipolaris]MDG2989448.1 hypothetical protein [Candidatus Synechococcus calcipolaris G9]
MMLLSGERWLGCAISGNKATDPSSGGGGGIVNNVTVNVTNSIISGNESTATVGPEINNGGALNFTGNNLVGQNNTLGIGGGISSGAGNVITPSVPTSQIIGPLANNGGPTQTHALLPDSPALAVGDPSQTGLPATDQRGEPRLRDGLLDLGAYQFQLPVTPTDPPTTTPAMTPVVQPPAAPLVVTPVTSTVPQPPVPPVTPPPTIFVFVPAPVELKFPQELLTILQGQEQTQLPLEQSLCQLLEERDEIVLEIDGVPVESALAAECS